MIRIQVGAHAAIAQVLCFDMHKLLTYCPIRRRHPCHPLPRDIKHNNNRQLIKLRIINRFQVENIEVKNASFQCALTSCLYTLFIPKETKLYIYKLYIYIYIQYTYTSTCKHNQLWIDYLLVCGGKTSWITKLSLCPYCRDSFSMSCRSLTTMAEFGSAGLLWRAAGIQTLQSSLLT